MSDLINSVQGWWIGSAIGGSAVMLVACLLIRWARGPAAVQRYGEWGMAAALLVAALRLLPSWIEVPDPRPAVPSVARVSSATVAQQPAILPVDIACMPLRKGNEVVNDVPTIYQPVLPQAAEPMVEPIHETARPPVLTQSLVDTLLLAYVAIAGLLLLRWLAGQWALARIIRQGRAAPEPVQQVFDRLAVQFGCRDARLIVSSRVPVPMCCGLLTPVVLIPRSLVLRNDAAVWRWVFAHELTHLARRDTWSTWAMGLVQALFFFVPWFWWLKRQVRLAQEYVADAAAVAQGRWAEDYAQFLVSLVHCPSAPHCATGVLGKTSDLYRRVTMVLKPNAGSAHSRRQLVTGVASLLASAVLLAGLGVRAAGPESDKKNRDVEVKVEEKPNVEIEVIMDDDAKKEGDKKAEIKKRIMLGGGGVDKAEIEKKLRAALAKVKLTDEEVDKIVKEVTKGLEQAKVAIAMAPLAGQHIAGDAMKHLEMLKEAHPGAIAMFRDGDGAASWTTRWAHWPTNGRLGIIAEKPTLALVEQLDLPRDHGLVVTEVRKNSAAEKSGFRPSDIVLVFAGKQVPNDTLKFIELLDDVPSDKDVECVILRKGKKEVLGGIKLADKVEPKEGEKSVFRIRAGKDGEEALVTKIPSNMTEKKTNKSVSVNVQDDQFKATEKEGDLTITVNGTVENKKVTVTGVAIEEPGFSGKYSSLDKVPSKYRGRVEKLISNTGDSSIRFDSRKE